MEPNAEQVIQNVGATAEAVSIFYNTIARQVPKDVALALTQQYMSLTINRQSVDPAKMMKALQAMQALAEAQRLAAQQRKKEDSGTQTPKTPPELEEAGPEERKP